MSDFQILPIEAMSHEELVAEVKRLRQIEAEGVSASTHIDLPPLPMPQVPLIDADIDLMDIRRLADWCKKTAKEYARAAVEADRQRRGEPVKVPEGYVLIAEDYLEVMIGPERMDHLRRSCRFRVPKHTPDTQPAEPVKRDEPKCKTREYVDPLVKALNWQDQNKGDV